jgi:hypothetical protein
MLKNAQKRSNMLETNKIVANNRQKSHTNAHTTSHIVLEQCNFWDFLPLFAEKTVSEIDFWAF